MELPAAERDAFLDGKGAAEPEILAEAWDLLARRTASEGFLESPMGLFDRGLDQAEVPIGVRIGAYRVTEEVGRGGMGAVYLAERADEQFHHKVAIKVLRHDSGGVDLMRRFRTERQILAELDHPGIARLLDGGTTDDGRPYLVMEYVRGTAIDRFCEQHGLGVHDRIRLFLKVCEAVAFAHRNLVVHRDLKPGNILINKSGEVKLLDFGIAKLLDPSLMSLTDETTLAGHRPMSPSFASPEHIKGRPITTSSDVYSLGVLLYLLLSGELPRRFNDYTVAAMERGLRRQPTAPSEAVGASERRDASRQRRLLAGDLDAIILKALRDEPEHRYPTVDALVEDLRRSIDGRPVQARRGNLAYRTGRLLRRNKAAVGGACLVAALVAAFTITVTVQARQLARERDVAQRVAQFMGEIFAGSNPQTMEDGSVRLNDVLERGVENVERVFSDDPEIQARLLRAVAGVYIDCGMYRQAVPLLRRSIDLQDSLGGRIADQLPGTLNDLGEALINLGEVGEVEDVLHRAQRLAERGRGKTGGEAVTSLKLLGMVHLARSELDEATDCGRRAVALSIAGFGPEHERVAAALTSLGYVLGKAGDFDEAEQVYRQALEVLENQENPPARQIAAVSSSLGLLYLEAARPGDAIPLIERAIAVKEGLYGDTDPRLANDLNNLAAIHEGRGELSRAADLYQRALGVAVRGLDHDSPALLKQRHNLAVVLLRRGDLEGARQQWSELLEVMSTSAPGDHASAAAILASLAIAEQHLGLLEQAARHDRDGLERSVRAFPDNEQWLAMGRRASARVRLGLGDLAAAERLLRINVASPSQEAEGPPPSFVIDHLRLSEILITTGRLDEAASRLDGVRRYTEETTSSKPSPSRRQKIIRYHLSAGDLQRAMGDQDGSTASWLEALHLIENEPPEHRNDNDIQLLRVAALLRLGRPGDARSDAETLLSLGWQRPAWIRLARSNAVRPGQVPAVLY
jgi:tetratricopeptide (TPR) repeat protein/tRNA A-37 threonylcarbamoyl transferase component Bud32